MALVGRDVAPGRTTVQRLSANGLRVVRGGDRRGGPTPTKPKLLDRTRDTMRSRHYRPNTERSYCNWVKRFIYFYVITVQELTGYKNVKTTMV